MVDVKSVVYDLAFELGAAVGFELGWQRRVSPGEGELLVEDVIRNQRRVVSRLKWDAVDAFDDGVSSGVQLSNATREVVYRRRSV